jgi:hypothetical protein
MRTWPSICTIFTRLSLLLEDKSIPLVRNVVEKICKTGLGWETEVTITRPFMELQSLTYFLTYLLHGAESFLRS